MSESSLAVPGLLLIMEGIIYGRSFVVVDTAVVVTVK